MAIPTPLIAPKLITNERFETYTNSWYNLVIGDDLGKLQSCFIVDSEKLMNYAYLTKELMDKLLYQCDNKRPCVWAKFVLVPQDAAPEKLLFSIVLYSSNVNPEEDSHPYYCLAGIRPLPAKVVDALGAALTATDDTKPVNTPTAADWVKNWNKKQHADELSFDMLGKGHERLLGYTFPLSDFQNAWKPEGITNPELWLNFDMHMPLFPEPQPDAPLVLSTMIDTNHGPSEGNPDNPGTITIDDYYKVFYDISRPCPPYCDANWVGNTQATA